MKIKELLVKGNIILKDNNIQYIKEYTFKDLISKKGGIYRFDFAIFENDKLVKLIEFDGQ